MRTRDGDHQWYTLTQCPSLAMGSDGRLHPWSGQARSREHARIKGTLAHRERLADMKAEIIVLYTEDQGPMKKMERREEV